MDANRTCESVCIIDVGVLIKQAVMVYFIDTCFIDTRAKAYNFFLEETDETLAHSNSLHLRLTVLIASKANDFE